MTNLPFPTKQATLTYSEVVDVLTRLQEEGYIIGTDVDAFSTGNISILGGRPYFYVDAGEGQQVRVNPEYSSDFNGYYAFQRKNWGFAYISRWTGAQENQVSQAHNIAELDQRLREQLGSAAPSKYYLKINEPATNRARFAQLIGSSAILTVFDPYLTNVALQNLTDMKPFGVRVANNIRLLTHKSMTAGSVPRLTESFTRAWFSEHGVLGEVRVFDNKQHRRFLLLEGEKSLVAGGSFSQMEVNERIAIDDDKDDDKYDRAFFEEEWAKVLTLWK